MAVPKFDDLMNPTIKAMHELGGSASVSEMEEEVARILDISEDDLNQIHRGNTTKFNYRLAWTRNYLKRYGILENSTRGIWALTSKGSKTTGVDKEEVKRIVRVIDKKERASEKADKNTEIISPEVQDWKEELLETIKNISPSSFEKLCQRLLRESGFIHVEVTGKSGDGGIDGKGVMKIGGLLSFHVIFQCKRYNGSVPVSAVRDFRGAMVGRADKGLLITTGTFTREARSEAQRDGTSPIDLIDGDDLAEKLKTLSLGLKTEEEVKERVIINKDWFQNL